jgi:hypothetical protein
VLRNPIIGGIRAVADENHAHVLGPWRPNRSGPVGDHEHIEPEARRHAVDFLAHRASVAVNINDSQLAARFLLNRRFSPTAKPEPITAD